MKFLKKVITLLQAWSIHISAGQGFTQLLPWKVKEYNWINFIPIEINFEAGWYKGKYFEFRICLINIWLSIEVYHKAERNKLVQKFEDIASQYWDVGC